MACRFVQRTRRHPATFFLLLVVAFYADHAQAQSFDGTHLSQPAKLDMKWLVNAGDNRAFADPRFDDTNWVTFDPYTSIAKVFPQRPSVVWYRLHVKLDPSQKGLALSEVNISRAFEVYVNGERIIASGRIDPYAPYTPFARIVERIPDRLLSTSSAVIAIRAYLSPLDWIGQDAGYYGNNLTLGEEGTLQNDRWLAIIGENALQWLDDLLVLALGCIALVLFAAQRQQIEYLWIAAVGALVITEKPLPFIATFHNVPVFWELPAALPRLAAPFIWVSLYFAFVHQRLGWRWRGVLIITGILDFVGGLHFWFLDLPLPVQFLTNIPFIFLLSVVVPIMLAVYWWRGNREAGILLIPSILFSLYIYAEVAFDTMFQIPAWRQAALRGLAFIDHYPAGPFSISLHNVTGLLSTISLAIILLQRSITMSRRQALLDTELEAAREVQRVLVPEHRGTVPGFAVETVYEPAQQVGGDFFQFIPTRDGGLLIVVGDVAGKGLPAAMLVSVLVGAISGLSDYTQDPAELLEGLNERLVGRSGGGFSTAVAAHFFADGQVTVSNAGHLSPYLDGKEVELPGALPLGVASSTSYETTTLHLDPGSRLTFYSDGVIEAQRPDGELFGFDRARDMSIQPASAIVKAAKQFGQQDDITVVSITRTAAIQSAAWKRAGTRDVSPESIV